MALPCTEGSLLVPFGVAVFELASTTGPYKYEPPRHPTPEPTLAAKDSMILAACFRFQSGFKSSMSPPLL